MNLPVQFLNPIADLIPTLVFKATCYMRASSQECTNDSANTIWMSNLSRMYIECAPLEYITPKNCLHKPLNLFLRGNRYQITRNVSERRERYMIVICSVCCQVSMRISGESQKSPSLAQTPTRRDYIGSSIRRCKLCSVKVLSTNIYYLTLNASALPSKNACFWAKETTPNFPRIV